MSVARDEILGFLAAELEIERYRDYGPNGLQVVGAERVDRVAFAVSATLETLDRAADDGAQLLIVHHGLFWNRDDRVVGPLLRRRLATLFEADMTLAAYHLPLDGHPRHGNNAQLAHALEIEPRGGMVEADGMPLGVHGPLAEPLELTRLAERVATVTRRQPQLFVGGPDPVRTVGICSGGAADGIGEAAALGLDAYVSGEPAEWSRALALELGVSFLAAGHHATETFGVRALARLLADRFDLETTFLDVENPV
jgi:dinuclear metal center YbgI/SA1388 family protein